ncbi:serpin family protein [Evansella tamaricis]|uniref:Serpin family protein n=1 Tax=Evansella tamaricis TaxID=2069301 RepID=A0ABS6JFX1_9BACI|nr:serpin family protein [Evansella tamaricis]MBU9711233.1 serpin family protein [Evansella tamaricis]
MRKTISRSKILVVLLILVLAGTVLAGCGQEKKMRAIEKQDPIFSKEDVSENMSESINRFSTNLFGTLYQKDTNQMISPFSIASALSMLLAGADGDTKGEILSVLQSNQFTEEEIHTSHQALLDILQHADPGTTLLIANSLWIEEDIEYQEDFIKVLQNYYDAETSKLTSAKEINNWVEEKTFGRIDNIVQEIDPNTVMHLVNAVYFLGEWWTPFQAQLTSDGPFYKEDGVIVTVPFMSQGNYFQYTKAPEYEVIRLPYMEGRVSMDILLPDEKMSVEDLLEMIQQGEITWDVSEEEVEGQLKLPKFTFTTDMQLNSILESLGMPTAFESEKADFSRMTTDYPLFISEVKHKSFIEVNETGTEAAAVTSIGMDAGSAPPDDPFEMVVDRPFLFRIIDETTGVILFMGHVVDPTT